MKKLLSVLLSCALFMAVFTACDGAALASGTSQEGAAAQTPSFDTSKSINVVTREEGSGTRGAFIELFGIEVKNDDGTKKDMTTDEADVVNKTDVMLTSVVGDGYAIGYVSLGSLNDTIKALQIDGVAATPDNVKNGTYKIARPFNIATKGEATGLAKDFIDYILSQEGQAVVVGNKYIAIDDSAAAYAGSKPTGKLVIAGSSSVTPVMEKLAEAYKMVNPAATIEIQMSDSTAGMTGAIDGTCDIGMASRALKDSEKEKLTSIEIALDGIAVIVNKANPLESLSKDQVRAIFVGEATAWSAVQ